MAIVTKAAAAVTAAQAIANYKANPSMAAPTIQDNSANLALLLDQLKQLAVARKIVAIAVIDTKSLPLSAASFAVNTAVLALLPASYTLAISGVAVSGVATAQANGHIVSFTVADTAANIVAGLAALNGAAKLSAIAVSNGTAMTLTFAQFGAYTLLLEKLPANAALTVTGATATGAAAAQSNARVKSFSVADTVPAIAANFNALLANTKLAGIAVIGTGILALTAAQYGAAVATPGKLPANATFALSGIAARSVAAMQANAQILSFTVADTAANIAAMLSVLATATKLQAISVADGAPLAVTSTQLAAFGAVVARLPANYGLNMSGATVAAAAQMQANTHVRAFSVSDTGTNIVAALDALNTLSKLAAIQLTDSSILTLASGQYNNDLAALSKIGGAWLADASGVSAAAAAGAQTNIHIRRFSVTDTAAAVAANLDAMNSDTKLSAIQVTGSPSFTLTAAQLAADTAALGKIAQNYQATVTGATVAGLAAIHANAHVVAVKISDTAANVANGLAALANDPTIVSIALTGGTILQVNQTQFFAFNSVFGKLEAQDRVIVGGVSAANAAAVQANTRVSSFGILDTASNIQTALDTLATLGKISSVSIAGYANLSVGYMQFLGDAALLGKFVGTFSFTVSGATSAVAAALTANAHVSAFTVTDTLANIGSKLDQLEAAVKAGKLSSIQVSDTGGAIAISAAQYTADADAIALMHGAFTIDKAAAAGAKINLIWDSQAMAAPAAFRAAVTFAAQYIQSLILNPIQIDIAVGYGEVAGSALGNGVLGAAGPTRGVGRTYAQFKNDLATHVSSPAMQAIVDNLPGADPSGGGTIYVASAEEKALGLMSPTGGAPDGTMGFAADQSGTLFAYDPNNRAVAGKYDLIGVVEHEITHALGRIAMGGTYGKWISALDVFRFSAPGTHSPNAGGSAYFSVDNGVTNLDPFATSSDLADWSSAAGNDANNAFSRGGVVNIFGHADIVQLNALGFATSGTPVTVGASLISGSATGGLNGHTLTFMGAPALAILNEEAPIFEASLNPSAGIEIIAGFEYGIYELRIDLAGASPEAFSAFDTTMDGGHAIALANRADLSHGLVLTGLPATATAADLLAHHVSFSPGHAIVA